MHMPEYVWLQAACNPCMVAGSRLGSMGVCADGHQYRLVDAAPTIAAMLRVPAPRQVCKSGAVTSMRT